MGPNRVSCNALDVCKASNRASLRISKGLVEFFLGQGFVCTCKVPSEPCLFFREFNFESRGVLSCLRKCSTSVAFLRGGMRESKKQSSQN